MVKEGRFTKLSLIDPFMIQEASCQADCSEKHKSSIYNSYNHSKFLFTELEKSFPITFATTNPIGKK